MVYQDLAYIRSLIESGVITGRVLEVGSYNHSGDPNGTAEATCTAHGLQWEGADLEAGPGVNFVLDILDPDAVNAIDQRWDSVLVLNLLEHVYDPITALKHSLQLTTSGGICLIVGPAVWQLHDYPADYWRPLPDFFTEFARRNDCEIVAGSTQWLLHAQADVWKGSTSSHSAKEGRMISVGSLRVGSQKNLPGMNVAIQVYGRWRTLRSRAVHRALHTIGRDLYFPCVGLGVALRKTDGR